MGSKHTSERIERCVLKIKEKSVGMDRRGAEFKELVNLCCITNNLEYDFIMKVLSLKN